MNYIFVFFLITIFIVTGFSYGDKQANMLQFLYHYKIGKIIRHGIVQPIFSKSLGCFCDLSLSRYAIPSFIKTYNIDINEAQNSLDSYKTFNDFFIRRLKSECRPINKDPLGVISPADGKCIIINTIYPTNQFPVKNISFNLEKFLQDKELADEYYGGTLLLFRLDPWDYHRFHLPIDGVLGEPTIIKGSYESVNPATYHAGVQALTENERHTIILTSEIFGKVLIIPVGALCVGRIKYTYCPNTWYAKGTEIGYFAFGGSTIAVLFKPNTLVVEPFLHNAHDLTDEVSVLMGQQIAHHQ